MTSSLRFRNVATNVVTRSASLRLSVMWKNIVAMALGNDSALRPVEMRYSSRRCRPAANSCGSVLYADASHPSANRATRFRPMSDPQLPIQIGMRATPLGFGSSSMLAVS